MDAEKVAAWMNALTDKEFVEFFYAKLSVRHIYDLDRSYLDSHLVLANATRVRAESGEPEPWSLQLLCPTPDKDWVSDSPICQFGHCCGIQTSSWAKDSTCPVCGGEVYGT
jgi:hypothetical protein